MSSSKRKVVVATLTLAAFVVLYGAFTLVPFGSLSVDPSTAIAQGDAEEIGVAPVGRTAFEFTGRIDQEGEIFRIYGYIPYIYGLDNQPPSLLFTHPITHSEATARITLSGTTTLTERTIISNVFHVDSIGTVNFYFDEDTGASYDDLASFDRGELIGSASVRLQNILTVTGPNTGIASGSGEMIQTEALSFELDGNEYQFGRRGMVQRVTFSGGGIRMVPEPPVAIIAVGGAGTVAGFDTFVPSVEK
jgi:hypothetical protein